MKRILFAATVTLALACSVGAVLAWQRQVTETLRAELATLRARDREYSAALTENVRLRQGHVSSAELESLRADHADIARLRGEIETLMAGAR